MLLELIIPKQKLIICNGLTSGRYEVTDKIVNHIISECSKVAQNKCNSRHEWVGMGDQLIIVQ